MKLLWIGLGLAATALWYTRRGPGTGMRRRSATADSPNTAERLQESHFRGAFAGVGSPGAAEPRVVGEQGAGDEPERIQPGLPDFARGA
jgi:hypothetical protein